MKKDNSKSAAIPEQGHDSGKEPDLMKPVGEVPIGQPALPQEHAELPEAGEFAGEADGHRILAEEYNESAKLLGFSDITEKGLEALALQKGIEPNEAISEYLHQQLPRQDFYDQPVLLGEA